MYTVTYIHTNGTLNYPEHMSFNLFLHVAFFFLYLGKKKKKKKNTIRVYMAIKAAFHPNSRKRS